MHVGNEIINECRQDDRDVRRRRITEVKEG